MPQQDRAATSGGLDQRADQLGKQEKMVEGNQRRLAEKIEDAQRRQKELDDLLDVEEI